MDAGWVIAGLAALVGGIWAAVRKVLSVQASARAAGRLEGQLIREQAERAEAAKEQQARAKIDAETEQTLRRISDEHSVVPRPTAEDSARQLERAERESREHAARKLK